jgi:flagellar biosynthetic protein FliP
MMQHVREKDLGLFVNISKTKIDKPSDVPYQVLIPAFMISELRRAFEIGFLIFIPFLIIDMVVASVLMAMGMMMLPPAVISLPFKIIFFVLIDGWYMLSGSLVRSFGVV